MTYFPPELLQQIFIHLHQKDKVECLTVCRLWKRTLESTILFQVLSIMTSTQMYRLIKRMEQEPNQRQKVKRLILGRLWSANINIGILFSLFSNIEELSVYEDVVIVGTQFPVDYFSCIWPETLLQEKNTWSRTIRYIKEEIHHKFAHRILQGGVCPLLTEITIGGRHHGGVSGFFDLLGNTPALQILVLRHFNMTLMDLEILHGKAPLLLSLSLEKVYIDISTVPTEITPANSIVKLHVEIIVELPTQRYIALLNYLAKKYTRTSEIVYSIGTDRNANFEECMSMGLVPHLEQVAPFLESLKISNPQCVQYVFPALDRGNCQLKEFAYCDALDEYDLNQVLHSNQAKSIQKFTINLSKFSNLINRLSSFETLCELNITSKSLWHPKYHNTIYLDELLEKIASTLTTLKLVNVGIAPVTLSSIPICRNIKTLTLQWSNIPPSMDRYISQAFPSLRHLIIKHCTSMPPHFNLSSLDLFYLELIDTFPSNQIYVLITTLCNNQKRYFTMDRTMTSDLHTIDRTILLDEERSETFRYAFPVKSLPFEKHRYSPKVAFVCNSLHTFYMMNTGL